MNLFLFVRSFSLIKFKKNLILTLISLISLFQVNFAEPLSKYATVSLISEHQSFVPGKKHWIGIYAKLKPGWHLYWKNPGDSGLPISVKWNSDINFEISKLHWPTPVRISTPPLASYGYEKEVLYLFNLTLPKHTSSSNFKLNASIEWLICKEICLPESFKLTLKRNIAKNTSLNASTQALFKRYKDLLPQDHNSKISFNKKGEKFYLTLPKNFYSRPYYFFPTEQSLLNHTAQQPNINTSDSISIELPIHKDQDPKQLDGILAYGKELKNSIKIKTHIASAPISQLPSATNHSLWIVFLFAFLGGLILNLMPCVLPVLSLKILNFVQQSNESHSKLIAHGLLFTLGVFTSFWVLAFILLSLRASGEELGWGFQLQSPHFLIFLSFFLFLFALNLFGLFETGTFLTRWGGAISSLSNGLVGSFLNGVTATIVATPCSAPFMGSALGIAVTLPALQSFLIFSFLAFGMSFPYLLLSIFPAWIRYVPKPGIWMEHFKQWMGFPLLATIIWLLWVLAQITDADVVIDTLSLLLCTTLVVWMLKTWKGWISKLISFSLLFFLVSFTYQLISQIDQKQNKDFSQIWLPYDEKSIQKSLDEGFPVFIDFTASWCISCQVNKKLVLQSEKSVRLFKEFKVKTYIADWTKKDTAITHALAKFNRNSVPLYVFYKDKDSQPILLPEILTKGILSDTLNQLNSP